ncbi:MAG: DNA-directed RNA polymerase subunit beta [Deltaproteobacteria bacterium]|jgi:DNA-directed RNA polymerase subunit beta|nr:DNA-directed RNA polymerase subunit beta [Deltaproteobacteria bacterium]
MNNKTPLSQSRRLRLSFGKTESLAEPPHLLEIQLESYDRFSQKDRAPEQRGDFGLQGLFKSYFPIQDDYGLAQLKFLSYALGDPKRGPEQCLAQAFTYQAPLKISVVLEIYDQDLETGLISLRVARPELVDFGYLPLMTPQGTFIINGIEKVIVPCLQACPGLFFNHDQGKTHPSGKFLYYARILPKKGPLLDLEFGGNDLIYARFNGRRKFLVTSLFKALGYQPQELLDYFYQREILRFSGQEGMVVINLSQKLLLGRKAFQDFLNPFTGELILKKGQAISLRAIEKLKALGINQLAAQVQDFFGQYLASDILDPQTKQKLLPLNSQFTKKVYDKLMVHGVKEIWLLFIDNLSASSAFRDTLAKDKLKNQKEALKFVYFINHQANPASLKVAKNYLNRLFFRSDSYDLGPVGRFKLNRRLFEQEPERAADKNLTFLRPMDIIAALKELLKIKNSKGQIDQMVDLANRRVITAGEFLENQFRFGLTWMAKGVKEALNQQEFKTLKPHFLLNAKPVMTALKKFFDQSEFSQALNQNNPLSEIDHKRRLADPGPSAWSRDDSKLASLDLHASHLGRLCPIEKPKYAGPGNFAALALRARINQLGFIQAPYDQLENNQPENNQPENNQPSGQVIYLSPLDGPHPDIAQPDLAQPNEVKFINFSPDQLVSIGPSLIPFLEHDDPNSALQGCNDQNQAVPLLKPEAPLIGTLVEGLVARDSALTVLAPYDGLVEMADATRIVTSRADPQASENGPWLRLHKLKKFRKTNQKVCFNQKPIVKAGQAIKKGQVLADGPATELGELALGRNVMVALMPWEGQNANDSILVSERLVKEDIFTSIHIEVFESLARETKHGPEEFTNDIPNVDERSLVNLDQDGIIGIGQRVTTGNILVGRVRPRADQPLSPEELLLKAIFGAKASSVIDTSLRVPPGVEGTVIDVKVFCQKDSKKLARSIQIEQEEIDRLIQDRQDEISVLTKITRERLAQILVGKSSAVELIDPATKQAVLNQGEMITAKLINSLPPRTWLEVPLNSDQDGLSAALVQRLVAWNYQVQMEALRQNYDQKIENIEKGYELPQGVLSKVKVYVAMKRKLSPGDKMAGRHGNKGVVSRILPQEDMPFLADGTPVDLVLNPLGLPSRLNLGQILESHLGWASQALGRQIGALVDSRNALGLRNKFKRLLGQSHYENCLAELSDQELLEMANLSRQGLHMASPVFDGANESDIKKLLGEAGLPEIGQMPLRDGRTGEFFENQVTVGTMYMLKLNHLVEDLAQARSIGPYSFTSLQPLGGKDKLGGQSVGDSFIMALAAYGAAYNLQEFLTVKSDDVTGRTRMYEKIIRGESSHEPGLPESFNVMVKELMSLGFDIDLGQEPKSPTDLSPSRSAPSGQSGE